MIGMIGSIVPVYNNYPRLDRWSVPQLPKHALRSFYGLYSSREDLKPVGCPCLYRRRSSRSYATSKYFASMFGYYGSWSTPEGSSAAEFPALTWLTQYSSFHMAEHAALPTFGQRCALLSHIHYAHVLVSSVLESLWTLYRRYFHSSTTTAGQSLSRMLWPRSIHARAYHMRWAFLTRWKKASSLHKRNGIGYTPNKMIQIIVSLPIHANYVLLCVFLRSFRTEGMLRYCFRADKYFWVNLLIVFQLDSKADAVQEHNSSSWLRRGLGMVCQN